MASGHPGHKHEVTEHPGIWGITHVEVVTGQPGSEAHVVKVCRQQPFTAFTNAGPHAHLHTHLQTYTHAHQPQSPRRPTADLPAQ